MAGRSSRFSRVLMTGPLAAFADAYAAELKERGYTPLTAVNELRQVGRLSWWLDAGGLGAADLSGERVEEFLVWQRAGGRHRAEWSRPGLLCLLDVLRGLGVLAAEPPAPPSSATGLLLASFERYLLTERGLATGTVGGYLALRNKQRAGARVSSDRLAELVEERQRRGAPQLPRASRPFDNQVHRAVKEEDRDRPGPNVCVLRIERAIRSPEAVHKSAVVVLVPHRPVDEEVVARSEDPPC